MKYQKKVGSNTTALIFVGEPIFAMVFSFLFIGEKMNGMQIIGAIILIFAILLASLEKRTKLLTLKEY
jgi:drug/metabolite transporter (DMT)-like permease